MSKKFGLGKGLGALIPDNIDEHKESEKNSVLKISINKIKANRDQPRKSFDEDKITELACSIKEHGVIQPIILREENNNYIIIAGERRWRAAKSVGLKELPAVIMNDISNKQVLEISLIENIQREDLNPIEEAIAYKSLLDDFNLTQDELSKRVGKSRTAITNCLRLLNLDERVQEYLIDKAISEGHGRTLLGIKDKDIQYKLAQKIIDENLSVRECERLIKDINNKKTIRKNKSEEISPYYIDISNRMQNYFGTKVSLNPKGKENGKIEIEYYSQEDLERIIELLNLE